MTTTTTCSSNSSGSSAASATFDSCNGPGDVSAHGLRERLADFAARGAPVIAAGPADDIAAATIQFPAPAGEHPVIGAIAAIQSFYGLANAVAIARGRDPDRPPHLAQVTRTL